MIIQNFNRKEFLPQNDSKISCWSCLDSFRLHPLVVVTW